jgi:acetoin utilization protein AcuB
MSVKEAMKTDVITLSPTSSVEEAAHLMQQKGIKGIPIVDNGNNLVGIIANIDVMKIHHNRWQWTRVKDIMSTDLAVAHSEDQLDYALNLMRQRNIGHLPVVEEKSNHKLIGIITTSDIVGKYMENQNSFKQPQNDTPEHSK